MRKKGKNMCSTRCSGTEGTRMKRSWASVDLRPPRRYVVSRFGCSLVLVRFPPTLSRTSPSPYNPTCPSPKNFTLTPPHSMPLPPDLSVIPPCLLPASRPSLRPSVHRLGSMVVSVDFVTLTWRPWKRWTDRTIFDLPLSLGSRMWDASAFFNHHRLPQLEYTHGLVSGKRREMCVVKLTDTFPGRVERSSTECKKLLNN